MLSPKKTKGIKEILEVMGIESDKVGRIMDIIKEDSPTINENNLYIRVTNVLREFAIPANLLGYRYLREAIIISFANPEYLEEITIGLYPTVAQNFNTTPTRVERTIRHAIEVGWDRADLDVLHKYFGYSVSSRTGKPTNSQFIATIVDNLRIST